MTVFGNMTNLKNWGKFRHIDMHVYVSPQVTWQAYVPKYPTDYLLTFPLAGSITLESRPLGKRRHLCHFRPIRPRRRIRRVAGTLT